MSGKFHLRGAYICSLLALILFLVVSLLVMYERVTDLDATVISTVQGWENPNFTRVMEAFSWLGSTTGVTVLAVVILLFLTFVLGHRKELILFITAIGGAALLNAVLKSIFQRDRPNIYRLAEETGYSFPSGHSMVAFALYVVLIYLLWRHTGSKWGRVILIAAGSLFIASIGLSRIYLGVHYPSDVVGGYLASGIWLGLIIGIYQRLVRTLSNK